MSGSAFAGPALWLWDLECEGEAARLLARREVDAARPEATRLVRRLLAELGEPGRPPVCERTQP